eukprot:NODE_156_length_16689_cov_0.273960.p3 type:complete len:366 gc:universal NODE_156_length_16689_cov_0.273960:3788-2691(-)
MASLFELDLNGFISLFSSEVKKQASPSQLYIVHTTDIKLPIDTKQLKFLVVTLSPLNLIDSLQKQILELICKSKLQLYCGPSKYIESVSLEVKEILLFGKNSGEMNDILEMNIINRFKHLTHLGLYSVSIEYPNFKVLLESVHLTTFEIANVQVLSIKEPETLRFSKESLTWQDCPDLDELFKTQQITGSAKILHTDNVNVLNSLKGHLKLLVKLDITFSPVDSRSVAKSLLLAHLLEDVSCKIIGARNEQTRMIFDALNSDNIEKLVIVPGINSLELADFERFKNLNCFGSIYLPFPFIKSLKLQSIHLHNLENTQFSMLNATVQNYQIKNIYFSGLPNQIMEFQKVYREQLNVQSCQVHLVNK